MTDVKICGIKTEEALKAAVDAGARFVGFVFYPDSPRNVSIEEAKHLAEQTPKGVRRVGLFVDPDNKTLEKTLEHVALDIIQLHGDETPERVAAIKNLTGKPVMKAIRLASKYDMDGYEEFETAADWLLFDAKPADADLPGGTGQSFDWSILKGRTFKKQWMLSGGLTAENVAGALELLNPKAIDVSSGVEEMRGVKDPDKIKRFIEAVKS